MGPMDQFEIELSLKLGIQVSKLRSKLTNREYDAYQEFYFMHGFGSRASYERSANEIITIITYITGAMGGKPQDIAQEDIYPQLSFSNKKKRPGKNMVNWETLPDRHKKAFIERGMFTDDGEPIPQNPHR